MNDDDWVVLGQVGKLFGVKGWVKVRAFTAERGEILQHTHFRGEIIGVLSKVELDTVVV